MNLYTVYIVIGYWPLGAVVCDLWLAVDYVVSNASVMNLLIISFDRYFCVTKPLSYPARRSTKMAGLMIAAAWVLSFILWAPAILFWQFIVGGRTVPSGQCYIQFFSNAAVTFGTAIAAFYLPVAIMIHLYWRISKASRSRMRKDSRKTSGTSLAEGPSNSQEEGYENNCVRKKQVKGEDRDGKEKEVSEQQNGSGPCKEEQADQVNSTSEVVHACEEGQVDHVDCTSEIVHASTSKDTTVHTLSQESSNAVKHLTQPSSPQNSAADRQSMVARTLLMVRVFYTVLI